MLKVFSEFYDDISKAGQRIDDALKEFLPVGARVMWTRGPYQQSGVIVKGGWLRVKAKNYATNKEVWISPYQIIGAMRNESKVQEGK